jgi:hypothetical protein
VGQPQFKNQEFFVMRIVVSSVTEGITTPGVVA